MIRRPPRSTPFPDTTLFRSLVGPGHGRGDRRGEQHPALAARRHVPEDVLGEEDGRPDVEVDDRQLVLDRVLDERDRKSTRLNSSHANISYAVFCLKKKQHTL